MTKPELGAINIILHEQKSSPDSYFVEIENDKGASIRIGERIEKDDGLVAIRIRAEDIINLDWEPERKLELPLWEETMQKKKYSKLNPVEQFIADNEPVGVGDEAWRKSFQTAL